MQPLVYTSSTCRAFAVNLGAERRHDCDTALTNKNRKRLYEKAPGFSTAALFMLARD